MRTWLPLIVVLLLLAPSRATTVVAQTQAGQGSGGNSAQSLGSRVGKFQSGESENVDPTNNPARTVQQPRAAVRSAADVGSPFPLAAQAGAGLTLNAYVDSSILSNPNSAAIQSMISQAVGIYQSQFSDPITVNILFRYSTVGPDGSALGSGTLAQSNYVVYFVSWSSYINALRADAKTSNDSIANASLPGGALSSTIDVASANGRAVGLNTPSAIFADGHVGSGGPYDGIVTINSSKPWQFTRPTSAGLYDFLRSTEHEIDEVLGLGSNVNNSSDYRPQDLFAWSGPGSRSFSSAGSRYFSINGGSNSIVGFNQTAGGDYGDWLSGSCPQSTPYVQNAFSCSGQYSDISASSPEGINLDVIGYDLAGSVTPGGAPGPPSNLTVSSSGSTVFLNWFAPTSGGAPAAYIIEAGSAPGLANLANFSTGNTATTFSASGVGAGSYYVRVRATNSSGTSAATADALLVVGGGCVGPPGPPTGFTITYNSGGTVSFSWGAGTGATSYIIEAGSGPGLANLANANLGSSATSATFSGVGAGTYYVRLRSVNACGVSGVSNEVVLVVGGGPTTVSITYWSAQFSIYQYPSYYETLGYINMTLNTPVTGTYRAEFNSYGFIGGSNTFSFPTTNLTFSVDKITSGCPDLHGTLPLNLYNSSNQLVASVQAPLHGSGCAFNP